MRIIIKGRTLSFDLEIGGAYEIRENFGNDAVYDGILSSVDDGWLLFGTLKKLKSISYTEIDAGEYTITKLEPAIIGNITTFYSPNPWVRECSSNSKEG